MSARFDKTYCSQCGGEFAAGDEGFSHCADHSPRTDCLPVPTDRNQGWPGVYAVLYTDEINGEQTCRDDLWIATTAAIKAAIERAQQEAYAKGRNDAALRAAGAAGPLGDPEVAETRGGFACPICGKDSPHHHSDEEAQRHREEQMREREDAFELLDYEVKDANALLRLLFPDLQPDDLRTDSGFVNIRKVQTLWDERRAAAHELLDVAETQDRTKEGGMK